MVNEIIRQIALVFSVVLALLIGFAWLEIWLLRRYWKNETTSEC
jgi:hypothetical protein